MEKKEKKEISKKETNKLSDSVNKYKNDKKYKAKIQLIIYGIVFIIIIAYANILRLNAPKSNITSQEERKKQIEKIIKKETKKEGLLEKISDNYEYTINISYIPKEESNTEQKELHYKGKVFKRNMEIIKEIDETKNNYYKVNTKYYTKDNDTYNLIKEEEIYNIVEKEFIELNSLKKYLDKANLDHVTDYSSGKKESVYHLKLKDIIPGYQDEDEIEINILEENNILTIKIDYTKLVEKASEDLKEAKIEYIYTNIGNVEEFKIIEENKENEVME